MRLTRVEQLSATLDKGFAPVYFFSGDEPLQLGEAADAVRSAARQAGFNREVFEVDARFRWQSLVQASDSLALFSDQKLLDIRLPSGKPGQEGAKVLSALAQQSGDEVVLLISAGKIASASTKSKWYQTLEQHGVVLQVWPLSGADLLRWVERRMAAQKMTTDQDGLRAIAHRVEGNLLAAAQEVDKLYMLHGTGFIAASDIFEQVADQARYDVFTLVDQVLMGRVAQVDRVLAALRQEGVAEPVVLWALARETRLLVQIASAQSSGTSLANAFRQHRVWQQRQAILTAALKRLKLDQLQRILLNCARIDRVIKGQVAGDAWAGLLEICLSMAGVKIFDTKAELF